LSDAKFAILSCQKRTLETDPRARYTVLLEISSSEANFRF